MSRAFATLVATVIGASQLGCGLEVTAPASLSVVDSFPSQGAQVGAGTLEAVFAFSEPLDKETLNDALLLEETSTLGVPLRALPARLQRYDEAQSIAVFDVGPLESERAYQLTLSAETLRAASGAALVRDFVRRFSVTP